MMECYDCGRSYPTDQMASARQCDGCAAPEQSTRYEKAAKRRSDAFKQWLAGQSYRDTYNPTSSIQAAFEAGWRCGTELNTKGTIS